MAGFDPIVILIGVLAAAIVVLLIRMLSQTNAQAARATPRAATVGASPPFAGGQSFSDMTRKSPGPRSSAPRMEQPLSPQILPAASLSERDQTPSLNAAPVQPVDAGKSETEALLTAEANVRAANGVEKEKETDLSPVAALPYGRRKTDLLKEETVHTLFSDLKRERKARFISFINFKGGVGKSTTAVETAASLAKNYGKRVLLIDLDPQTNATFYLMDHAEWESWQQTNGSLKTLFDAYLAGQGE